MIRMLDYGALAQLYAKTATDDLANRYVIGIPFLKNHIRRSYERI